MQDFEQAIQQFEAEFYCLVQIAQQYPQSMQLQSGLCGEWSARDVLAHLAGWIVEAKRRYPRYALGTSDIQYNKDAFNAVSIRLRKDKPYEDVLAELETLVNDFSQMAHEITEVQVKADKRYAEWLLNLAREAREHGLQLESFLKELG